jgi:uncharacterized protein YdeI (YjbR/CyaY-like superfamily)
VAELPSLPFASAEEFAAWIVDNPDAPGLWVQIMRVGSGIPTVSYSDAIDVALCHGWIDGQKGPGGEHFWHQRFTPRTARSKWSKINCGRVEQLIAAGRMRPAGLVQVEAARADGRWEAAYASPSAITVPADLQALLDTDAAAQDFFRGLTSANRYAILYRLHEAKRPETRARRLQTYFTMLQERRTIH